MIQSSPETQSLCFHFQHHHSLAFRKIKVLCLNIWHCKFYIVASQTHNAWTEIRNHFHHNQPHDNHHHPRHASLSPHHHRKQRCILVRGLLHALSRLTHALTHAISHKHTDNATLSFNGTTSVIYIDECCCVPIFASLLSQTSIISFPLY